jgi:hypothetical protein
MMNNREAMRGVIPPINIRNALMLRVLRKRSMLWATVFSLLLAVLVTVSGNASAQVSALPGESAGWTAETYTSIDHEVIINTPSTMGEAAPTSGPNRPIVRAFRGWDNALYVSVGGGAPFQLDGGVTRAAPRVVWNGSEIIIFHTGIDGRVYESRNGNVWALDNPIAWSPWNLVRTPDGLPILTQYYQAVSVTWLQGHGNQLYMVWHGAYGTDIFGSFYNGQVWTAAAFIPYMYTSLPPDVVWNQSRNRLFTFITGVNGQHIEYAYQDYGQSNWLGFSLLTPFDVAMSSPSAATTPNGDMEIAFTGTDRRIYHGIWPRWQNFQGFQQTLGGFLSSRAPYLIAFGVIIWAIATSDQTFEVHFHQSSSH